ncbi:type I restriction endonuclease subunit R [Leptothoe spongobia TAU-MAC 1115]|uniref:Type I restriction endonuclease subunit R n=1 Tax=Leptothoe spongobia TAU-MAC 1115 TaxID=1967444 RepID=A0A947GJZ5_9CYAN|nr:type I restriction endonuclease [Leptothoe spongobia]MBT9317425.1 type I restriction endonuclease subunit R [Leptothoe spongobia TAU-MAC 1115]
MNPDTQARYQANRLRVVPEVSYSPHARKGEYNPRLDLVLFINGIPTATLELKSEFKQSIENAKRQYCNDRPVTVYLWEHLFQPDAWLKVLDRFLHLQKPKEEDFDGSSKPKEKLIFPRYHQWQVVNQLIDKTRKEGAGQKYLIQHSAGSGKSNSIAWTAHQLASLTSDQTVD